MNHLLDLSDISSDELAGVLTRASDIALHPEYYTDAARGKILATLFYEPSTRTQMSFQTAMLRLGGSIIGFDDPSGTSVAKGETIRDTSVIVSGYADVMAIRHYMAGAPLAASLYSSCPVINAGDGGHLHPTQTLTDLLTLSKERQLHGLTVGVCGDLYNGRTVHSLVKALAAYENNRFVFISAPSLKIPRYLREFLDVRNIPYTETPDIGGVIGELSVLYMTRLQRERIKSGDKTAENTVLVLSEKILSGGRKDLAILHPLPRNEEIPPEIDSDPRALYFKQARYGMFVRQSLILELLKTPAFSPPFLKTGSGHSCINPGCISHNEQGLPALHKDGLCGYCEHEIIV
ncbi:aspartate carbamoyltransferase [Clostridia bacterium]|nr:aspartate carbamoyltransferase [Clostridia bacterium]